MSRPMTSPRSVTVTVFAVLSGLFAFIDTLIGGIIVYWGSFWNAPFELALGVSFILGAPAYLVDLANKRTVSVCMLTVFMLRWGLRCFAGVHPAIVNPIEGPVGILLPVSIVLMHLAKRASASD